MRILFQPAAQRGLRAKFDIGFIGDNQRFAARHFQQGTDILRVDDLPGRVIGAANKNDFHAVEIVGNCRQIKLPVVE
ncbi:hypothetical protein D3C78_1242090 [compost metagenome]